MWLFAGALSTGGAAWVAFQLQQDGVAPAVLFPIVVGAAVGGAIAAVGRMLAISRRLVLVVGASCWGMLAVLGQDYILDLELSALSQEGRGEVVASPRVITANQREAVIRQGDEVGYVTIAPVQGSTVPIPNVQFKEILLELKVTPTITQDERVFMVMNVKKDELSGFVSTSIGDVPPELVDACFAPLAFPEA